MFAIYFDHLLLMFLLYYRCLYFKNFVLHLLLLMVKCFFHHYKKVPVVMVFKVIIQLQNFLDYEQGEFVFYPLEEINHFLHNHQMNVLVIIFNHFVYNFLFYYFVYNFPFLPLHLHNHLHPLLHHLNFMIFQLNYQNHQLIYHLIYQLEMVKNFKEFHRYLD